MSFNIIGTGCSIPDKAISNDDLSVMMDTSDEWISTRTGIRNRYVSTCESAAELVIKAAKDAVIDAGIDSKQIDCVICSTMRGDMFTPAVACVVAEALNINVPAYDINAACTGLMYAFDIADCAFIAGRYETVLIVTVEQLSKLTDWTDRGTCVLFGDGAGAVILKKGEGLKSINISCVPSSTMIHGESFGGLSPFDTTQKPNPVVHMNGQEVYKFAVGAIINEIDCVLGRASLTAENIDYFLFHQANMRIIDAAAKRLKLPQEKVLTNIARYGNMSSTSIAVLLDEYNKKGVFKKGDKLLFVAFGAGMTSGACIIEWNK